MGSRCWEILALSALLLGGADLTADSSGPPNTSGKVEETTPSYITDGSTTFDDGNDSVATTVNGTLTNPNVTNANVTDNASMTEAINGTTANSTDGNTTEVISPEFTPTLSLDLNSTSKKPADSSVAPTGNGETVLTASSTTSSTGPVTTPVPGVTVSSTAAPPVQSTTSTSADSKGSSSTMIAATTAKLPTTAEKPLGGKQITKPSGGVVAGTVIGVLIGVALLVIVIFVVMKKTKRRREGYGMFNNIGGNNDDDGEWTFNNPSYGSNAKHTVSKGYSDMASY